MDESENEQSREKETKSKVRIFYKSLLKACDKYDEYKESFDEIYGPINEQYQELVKIPGLIPNSSQTIIQGAFDSIDEITGIADDFCSTLRGEFKPILERLNISVEDIVNEIAIEKAQEASSSSSPVDINFNATNIASLSNPIITKKIIAMILAVIAAGSGGIGVYATLDLDVDTPSLSSPNNRDIVNYSMVNFSWNAIDDKSGIQYYQFELFDEANNIMMLSKQITSTNFDHILENGDYSWRVKAIDNVGNFGDYSTRSFFTVKIFESPTAKIVTNANSIKVGQTLHLNAGQSFDTDGRITNYHWDFDDGTTGTGSSQNHTYRTSGIYTIKLTVTDDDRQSGTTYVTINVLDLNAPIAHIQADTTNIDAGQILQFYGSDSYDSDGEITEYYWNFDDGTTSNEMNPNHSFNKPGDYQVTLEVIDDDRLKDTTEIEISVNHTPPPMISEIYRPVDYTLSINYPEPSVRIDFEWKQVFDDDGIAYYEIELNDQIYPQKFYSNYNSIDIETEGEFDWRVRAVDNIGSVGPWSSSHTFTVDTYYPWTIAKVLWNPTEYSFTENLGFIQVIDNDVNNPDSIDSVKVQVTSLDNPAGVSVTLRESGDNTGIFGGTVDLTQVFDETRCNSVAITASYLDNRLPEGLGFSSTLSAEANKHPRICIY